MASCPYFAVKLTKSAFEHSYVSIFKIQQSENIRIPSSSSSS